MARKTYNQFLPWENDFELAGKQAGPDDRSGAVYLEDAQLRLATEVALVTKRPLLIRGDPGSGKSSYAPFVARNLQWRYYEYDVTGKTEARDLLWSFDALQRLRDAQIGEVVNSERYISPGCLWWAFDRNSALHFVAPKDAEPLSDTNDGRDPNCAVVLIDEIDKADTNVPNDLLEVLGQNRFFINELNTVVEHRQHEAVVKERKSKKGVLVGSLLVIITTNRERDLPQAFERRCVTHTLVDPDDEEQVDRLTAIARLHFRNSCDEELAREIALKTVKLRRQAEQRFVRRPSTAEFLDALKACLRLGISVDSHLWRNIVSGVLIKSPEWVPSDLDLHGDGVNWGSDR